MTVEEKLARIDERTQSILEKSGRLADEMDELRGVAYAAKNKVDNLIEDDFSNLRRIIREEMSLNRKDLFNIILAILNILLLTWQLTRRG